MSEMALFTDKQIELLEAEQNRGYNCIVQEVSRRYIMENNLQTAAYGETCFEDSDCLVGYCHGDNCCASAENVNCHLNL